MIITGWAVIGMGMLYETSGRWRKGRSGVYSQEHIIRVTEKAFDDFAS